VDIINPANIKKGIAITVNELIPEKQYCALTTIFKLEQKYIEIIVAPPIAKPTGTPIANIINNTMNKTKKVILFPPLS